MVMAEDKIAKTGRTTQLSMYDIMNADAQKWREEKQRLKEQQINNNTQNLSTYTRNGDLTNVKIQSLELKIYNECLRYIKQISYEKTLEPYVSEDEWSEIEKIKEQVGTIDKESKELEIQITEINEKLRSEKNNVILGELNTEKNLKLKRAKELSILKKKLGTKLFEIEENKTLNKLQKEIEEKVKQIKDNGRLVEKREENHKLKGEIAERKKEILEIRNRRLEKENKLLYSSSDLEEAWTGVLDEAFTRALIKYEAAINGPSKDKPFSLWFRNEISNAKDKEFKIKGVKLTVELGDAYYDAVSAKAKKYLKDISEAHNIKDFEMPEDIFTEDFFRKQLEEVGISSIEAANIAEDIFAKRNFRLDAPLESKDDGAESVWIRGSIENDNYEQEKEEESASDTAKWIILRVYDAIEKDFKEGILKDSLFECIKYRLTAQLYEEALTHKIEYKKMIDEDFLAQLIAAREAALKEIAKTKIKGELSGKEKDEGNLKRYFKKSYEVLAKMQGLEKDTARKKLNKGETELTHYYKLVLDNEKNRLDSPLKS